MKTNRKNVKALQQLALRLIRAQEDERQRISQEMHDDLGNRIALMALSVRHIIKQNSASAKPVQNELDNLFEQIMDCSRAVRELSHGLHPSVLHHIGIGAALKSLQEKFEENNHVQMKLAVAEDLSRLSDDVALCIFRVAQECLQNVIKHSGADQVTVVLAHPQGRIRLTVSDNGRGFVQSEAVWKGGLGLPSMEARARSMAGRLTINTSPRGGTEICLTLPMKTSAAYEREGSSRANSFIRKAVSPANNAPAH